MMGLWEGRDDELCRAIVVEDGVAEVKKKADESKIMLYVDLGGDNGEKNIDRCEDGAREGQCGVGDPEGCRLENNNGNEEDGVHGGRMKPLSSLGVNRRRFLETGKSADLKEQGNSMNLKSTLTTQARRRHREKPSYSNLVASQKIVVHEWKIDGEFKENPRYIATEVRGNKRKSASPKGVGPCQRKKNQPHLNTRISPCEHDSVPLSGRAEQSGGMGLLLRAMDSYLVAAADPLLQPSSTDSKEKNSLQLEKRKCSQEKLESGGLVLKLNRPFGVEIQNKITTEVKKIPSLQESLDDKGMTYANADHATASLPQSLEVDIMEVDVDRESSKSAELCELQRQHPAGSNPAVCKKDTIRRRDWSILEQCTSSDGTKPSLIREWKRRKISDSSLSVLTADDLRSSSVICSVKPASVILQKQGFQLSLKSALQSNPCAHLDDCLDKSANLKLERQASMESVIGKYFPIKADSQKELLGDKHVNSAVGRGCDKSIVFKGKAQDKNGAGGAEDEDVKVGIDALMQVNACLSSDRRGDRSLKTSSPNVCLPGALDSEETRLDLKKASRNVEKQSSSNAGSEMGTRGVPERVNVCLIQNQFVPSQIIPGRSGHLLSSHHKLSIKNDVGNHPYLEESKHRENCSHACGKAFRFEADSLQQSCARKGDSIIQEEACATKVSGHAVLQSIPARASSIAVGTRMTEIRKLVRSRKPLHLKSSSVSIGGNHNLPEQGLRIKNLDKFVWCAGAGLRSVTGTSTCVTDSIMAGKKARQRTAIRQDTLNNKFLSRISCGNLPVTSGANCLVETSEGDTRNAASARTSDVYNASRFSACSATVRSEGALCVRNKVKPYMIHLVRKRRGPKKSQQDKARDKEKHREGGKFEQLCEPSGLLGEFNPGIIQRVRNSQQIQAILGALVGPGDMDVVDFNAKREETETKHPKTEDKSCKETKRFDMPDCNTSGLSTAAALLECGDIIVAKELLLGRNVKQSNLRNGHDGPTGTATQGLKQTMVNHDNDGPTGVTTTQNMANYGHDGIDTTLTEDNHIVHTIDRKKIESQCELSGHLNNEDITCTASCQPGQIDELTDSNQGRQSSRDTEAHVFAAKSCGVNCTNETTSLKMPIGATANPPIAAGLASQWMDLLLLDIKGRLSALKRSRRRVRSVLVSEQLDGVTRSQSAGSTDNSAVKKGQLELHDFSIGPSIDGLQAYRQIDNWRALLTNMDGILCLEAAKLESWLSQIHEMQEMTQALPNLELPTVISHQEEIVGGCGVASPSQIHHGQDPLQSQRSKMQS